MDAMTLEPLAGVGELARWVEVLAPARQLAEVIADTDFVPRDMRGRPDVVTAAIMYGDELGLGPMQALAGIDVVEGKPRPSAELARALILRDGHSLVVHEATTERVKVSGLRKGAPEAERVYVTWTLDDARRAGLQNKLNWRNYPRSMLLARATGDLARLAFPDVVKGLGYIAETPESVQALESWTPPEVDAPPTPPPPPVAPSIQRRTRPRATHDVELPAGPSSPGGGAATGAPSGVAAEGGSGDPPPPDLPPERPTDPEVDHGPEPMRDAQRRAIFATLGRVLGADADRAQRLALCTAILGREVGSSNELTRDEAYEILAWLHELASGAVAFDYDHGAGIARVWRVEDPPPDERDTPLDPWSDLGGGHA